MEVKQKIEAGNTLCTEGNLSDLIKYMRHFQQGTFSINTSLSSTCNRGYAVVMHGPAPTSSKYR